VLDYGSADFTRRNQAILEGEKAALAALPQIRAALDKFKAQRLQAARAEAAKRAAAQAPQLPPCKPRPRFGLGRDQGDCIPAAN